MRCFLLTGSINGKDLGVAGIEVLHFHLSPISHLGQSNILKSVLYIEKSFVRQQIILSRSMMTRKKSLVTFTSNIKPSQFMNKPYNARSPSIKVLRMMMV